MVGCYGHGNEPAVSVKCRQVFCLSTKNLLQTLDPVCLEIIF